MTNGLSSALELNVVGQIAPCLQPPAGYPDRERAGYAGLHEYLLGGRDANALAKHFSEGLLATDMVTSSDKDRIVKAFRSLRELGYAAAGRAGLTSKDGYQRLTDLHPELEKYVYYTDQGDADAFDDTGNLRKTLHLYWRGDAAELTQAFRNQGLACNEPCATDTFELFPRTSQGQRTFEFACEAVGRRYGRSTGQPKSRETIYNNLPHEAALFRAWLSEHDPALFKLMEVDRELCPLDDTYERYVGFGLPDSREQ